MKNLTLKKLVLGVILLIVSVFTIAGPAFGLITYRGEAATGYDLLEEVSDIVGYSSEIDLAVAATFIMMFVGIAGFFVSILFCLKLDDKKGAKAAYAVLVLSWIGAILYTAAGGLIGEGYTVAFVPLILIFLFTVGFIACKKKMGDKPLNFGGAKSAAQPTPNTAPQEPASAASAEADSIELLIKYKKLLDDGIITQEEFDEKKSKLL